jgi:putative transcriptional regulator
MLNAPDKLAPGFLVALPQLRDPNFRRSVVLMTAHADDGAMGFVVNRRLPATVPEVLEGLDVPWGGEPSEPVWTGGPVSTQSGFVLFDGPAGTEDDLNAEEVVPGLFLSASIDTLRALGAKPPRRFRLLLGYAGWSPGQLESEVLQGAWMLLPPDLDLLFEVDPEDMWEEAFRRLGFHPGSVVPGQGVQ